MADAQRTIDLIFNGIDKTGAATQAALNNLGKFGGNVELATAPLAAFTAGALKLEAGILAAGAAMTLFSVNEAAKFESALFDLAKVLGDADGSIEDFAAAASDISAQYGVAATEVLAATANFKQAGFTGAEALQLVRNALDLKIAGDIEAARASDLLVASIKGFGLEAKAATGIVDLLNEVSNNYATNVDELTTGFALLSPVAKAAGFSLEETAGILTPGIEVFRSGSEVANGLRTVLLRLQADSAPLQAALAALGVTQRDTNGDLRTARDIYFDVAKAFGGLTDSQKTYYAAQLAGLDQSAKFIAVMEGIGTTTAIAGDGFDYLGSAAKEVEIRMQSAQTAVDRAKVAFTGLAVAVGTPLLDEFKGVTNAIAEIFRALSASVKDGELGELVAYIESIAGDVEATFKEVAKNLPAALAGADLSGFRGGIDAVLTSLRGLFSGIDLTTTEGLTKSIEFLGAAFLGLSKYTAGVIESFKPLFDLLVRVGQGAAGVDSDIFRLAGNIGGAATQLNLLAGGLNSLLPSIEALLGLMVVKQGIGLVGALAGLATGAGGAAGGLVTLATEAGRVVGFLQSVASGATVLTASLAGTTGLAAAALGAGYAVGTALNEPINKLVSALTGSKTTLGSWIYDLVNAEEQIDGVAVTVDGVRISLDQLNRGVESGSLVWDDVRQAWTSAGRASGELKAGLDGVAGAVAKVTTGPVTEYVDALGNVVRRTVESQDALDAWNAAILASGGVMEDAARSTGKLGEGVKQTGLMIDQATGAIRGYYGAFEDLTEAEREALLDQKAYGIGVRNTGDAASKTADELKRAEEATRKWNEEVAKMNHAEKLKLIEAQTTISVARIEADAQKTIAAFEGISAAIDSTGTTLGTLFGLMDSDKLSMRQMFNLEAEANKESKRRDEALKLQRDLTEAQIEEIRARTEAMQRGDALVKIEGDGLQPHLEAFMWEVLRAIQVRVNADGGAFLLGVNP